MAKSVPARVMLLRWMSLGVSWAIAYIPAKWLRVIELGMSSSSQELEIKSVPGRMLTPAQLKRTLWTERLHVCPLRSSVDQQQLHICHISAAGHYICGFLWQRKLTTGFKSNRARHQTSCAPPVLNTAVLESSLNMCFTYSSSHFLN